MDVSDRYLRTLRRLLPNQWMVWRTESAVRAGAIVMRLAGRDVSLATLVNGLWSTLFVGVAALSAWGRLGPR